MSQKVIEKEISPMPVFLSQDQNSSQAVLLSSQGQVKSQLVCQSQDRVSSQAIGSQASRVASQGQVLTQAEAAPQEKVSTQDSVSTQVQGVLSQPVVPTLSQLSSQKSVATLSNFDPAGSQKTSQSTRTEKESQPEIQFSEAIPSTPSQNSQNLKDTSWLLTSGQANSQGRDSLNHSQLLSNDENSNQPKTDE